VARELLVDERVVGLSFFDSRNGFERVLDVADAGQSADRAHGVTFGPIDDLPFADVDAWLDYALPVGGPRAYPLVADMRRDGTVHRPDARELTAAEALLRAPRPRVKTISMPGGGGSGWIRSMARSTCCASIPETIKAFVTFSSPHYWSSVEMRMPASCSTSTTTIFRPCGRMRV
jgi:hypothetical protein